MKMAVIGVGFVGATHCAVMASFGHEVIAFDIDKKKIADFASLNSKKIDSRIYEKGLAHLIQQNSHRIQFTSEINDIAKIANELDIVFMCLPTPSSDLLKKLEERFLFKAGKQLAKVLITRNNGAQTKRIIIVNKSTVPIGTAGQLKEKLEELGLKNFGIGSNPEFLVEGKSVEGSQNPDRVVLGCENKKDAITLSNAYMHLGLDKLKIMNPSDAEAVKLLSNFELFSRIIQTYHVIGRLCESRPDMNYENVISGITADKRLPKWGHHTSLYAGGSCFDKDAKNLLETTTKLEASKEACAFIQLVLDGNNTQIEHFFNRIQNQIKNFNGKKVALLGLAFKQDTNDVRMSAALPLTKMLTAAGIEQINAYDPQAGQNYLNYFEKEQSKTKLQLCKSAKEAIQKSDFAIICTDWPEFKFLTPLMIENCTIPYLIADGRRSLSKDYSKLAKAGFTIVAVGSPTISP